MMVFTALLLVGQVAVGTDPLFAVLTTLFLMLFTGAVNRGGGLFYASGAYIFFNGVLVCILGLVWKTLLLEPGQAHIDAPVTTMAVYCGGMGGMWLAVWASKRLTPKKGYLSSFVSQEIMMQSAIGCLILGSVLILAFGSRTQTGGTFGAALNEVNRFPQFAIMLATAYEIRASGGRRAWNWVVILQVAIIFALGVIYTSKEGMFQGPVTWGITAVAYGFNFRPKVLVAGAAFVFIMLFYMVPYSQYVRSFRDKDGSRVANQATALEYIFKLNEVRDLYKQQADDPALYTSGPHMFNTSQGLLDRLTAMPMDAALVDFTDQGYVFGLYPTYHGIIGTVPTLIWKNKPTFFTGNEYGRELTILSPDDYSTGIAFSPQADAYHQAKWFGIFVVMPLVCFTYFLANDAFAGSVKDSPWPLLLVVLASHLAPEGGIDSMQLQVVEGSFGLMFMAVVIRYILPLVVRVMTGGERTVVRKSRQFRLGAQPLGRAATVDPAAINVGKP